MSEYVAEQFSQKMLTFGYIVNYIQKGKGIF